MTFVVTEACIQCKYTDCVAVCPVWPVINVQKAPLPDHARWLEVKAKLDQLDRHGA
ncbi:MAG: DUF3470 domain-containing protein [Aquabacterium sp.]|nr:DUF3470 domain-containing protein [Aquabacterium sp.]